MNKNQNEITITEEESKQCGVCNKTFGSNRLMIWHVRKNHQLNFENYIVKVFYNDVRPICLKTGNKLSFKGRKLGPWFCNFSKNNFPRNPHTKESKQKIKFGCEKTSMEKFGVKNVFSTEWCKEKIKKTNLERYGFDNAAKNLIIKEKSLDSYYTTIKEKYKNGMYIVDKKTSILEIDFKSKLEKCNIEFYHPYPIDGRKYDFYLPNLKYLIEIDGSMWHADKLENLFLGNIISSVNDFKKNISAKNYNFFRIRYDLNDFNFSNEEELLLVLNKYKYLPNYDLLYKQKICNKKYFSNFLKRYGKEKLEKCVSSFLKFIRTFQPTLPYPDLEENLISVIDKISKYDLSKVYNPITNEFSNNISTVGHNYLKHHFHSYWKSNFNGNESPENAWLDDKIMKDVIEYRIGCNDSDEVFDFSLHQLVRGLSARRITISFFSPLLASAVYYTLLGNINNPIVLDPCCGFGSRLLGFKSKYPNGKYIGCEPNVETYNELIRLVSSANWNDVEIYNCKFEDYIDKYNKYDLIFTSIPYYNIEIYNNNIEYKSLEEWRNTFIKSIEKYSDKNAYINIPEDLSIKLNWNNIQFKILKNTSHFNKNKKIKTEYIIKL